MAESLQSEKHSDPPAEPMQAMGPGAAGGGEAHAGPASTTLQRV
jgi:hypothetical protein